MDKFLRKLSPSARAELAALLESDGTRLVDSLVAQLRTEELVGKFSKGLPQDQFSRSDQSGRVSGLPQPAGSLSNTWRLVETITFERSFPSGEVPVEHFEEVPVYETSTSSGNHRIALGSPRERAQVYGRERGWVSAWSIVNGTPRQLRAVFIECDDFDQSGDRAAIIYGLEGNGRRAFSPLQRDQLPAMYATNRMEVQRDRCRGPYAKNRLALIAGSDEVNLMLDHALRQARLRS